MKKNIMMRLASFLLVAVLISTSAISGTYAKYVTKATGNDTARVAKFGVVLAANSDLFAPEYNGINGISVKADDGADVIAPGTTGTAVAFTIAGAPEVDVEVEITLSKTNALSMVTLPADTYDDWTTAETDTYTLAEDYKPVKWTLKKDGTAIAGCENVNLDDIQTYFTNISKIYNVESDDFAALVNGTAAGSYELTWVWEFNGDDRADTTLGQIAAGVQPAPANHVGNESFDFSITVTQVD